MRMRARVRMTARFRVRVRVRVRMRARLTVTQSNDKDKDREKDKDKDKDKDRDKHIQKHKHNYDHVRPHYKMARASPIFVLMKKRRGLRPFRVRILGPGGIEPPAIKIVPPSGDLLFFIFFTLFVLHYNSSFI